MYKKNFITQYGTAEKHGACTTIFTVRLLTYCTLSVPHNELRHLAFKLENEKKILTFIVVKLDTDKPPSHQNNNHRDRF